MTELGDEQKKKKSWKHFKQSTNGLLGASSSNGVSEVVKIKSNSFLISLVVVNLEESKLVLVLGGGNYTQVLTKVLLLKVLLGQVLQVSL